mmetsp:Transcript_87474/g.145837  ORF Transcript_87474/g.145837 Transcript_87474/m.145837 type:complete len:140 (+) Transcript_87474:64-483(+)
MRAGLEIPFAALTSTLHMAALGRPTLRFSAAMGHVSQCCTLQRVSMGHWFRVDGSSPGVPRCTAPMGIPRAWATAWTPTSTSHTVENVATSAFSRSYSVTGADVWMPPIFILGYALQGMRLDLCSCWLLLCHAVALVLS